MTNAIASSISETPASLATIASWRSARFTFLDPAAHEFFTDWEKAAKDLVAALRQMAGRNPYDRAWRERNARGCGVAAAVRGQFVDVAELRAPRVVGGRMFAGQRSPPKYNRPARQDLVPRLLLCWPRVVHEEDQGGDQGMHGRDRSPEAQPSHDEMSCLGSGAL
jgi:hypothetical protein